ncbi:MAG TPA: OsmC family protein [Anaerolineaceae bacterium]|nr:OsmC family protein [Anaerolineaceae bacterium]HQH86782.1 OsmC family protein [Anaerolineaceae bacterium]HQN43923.1 OsmC family protein [Anaerolineaceae bacterium]
MPIKNVSIEAVQVEGFKIETRSRQHIAIVDQPVAGGGTDSGPTPLEYLFVSLAGCIVTIGHIVAKQRQLPVRSISARVEGELDTDVLMGKRSDVRAGFSDIRIHVKIDADMTQAEKEAFLKEVDARCPISDNIHGTTPLNFVVE